MVPGSRAYISYSVVTIVCFWISRRDKCNFCHHSGTARRSLPPTSSVPIGASLPSPAVPQCDCPGYLPDSLMLVTCDVKVTYHWTNISCIFSFESPRRHLAGGIWHSIWVSNSDPARCSRGECLPLPPFTPPNVLYSLVRKRLTTTNDV